MTSELKIYVESDELLLDLGRWMAGLTGVSAELSQRDRSPNAQGTGWDFLSVVCGTAGPIVAALRALQIWIESRVTVVEVVVGESRFLVRSSDAKGVLREVADCVAALESDASPSAGAD